jgi:hypothetical protein
MVPVIIPENGHLQVGVKIQKVKNLSIFPLSMIKNGGIYMFGERRNRRNDRFCYSELFM